MLTAEKIGGRHRLFIAMCMCAYFVFSIPVTILGSNAPVMMDYYGITAAQTGFVMTMQSAGRLVNAVILANKGEASNKIHSLSIGLLILFAVCAAIGLAPAYAALLVLYMGSGFGLAFVEIMANGSLSDIYPSQKNILLPFLQAFFAVGVMFTPVFVTLTVRPASPQTFSRPFLVTGLAAGLVSLLVLLSGKRIMAETPYADREALKRRAPDSPLGVFKERKAWFYLAAGVMYFTFLFGTIMWLPTYTIERTGADFNTAELMLTAFFAGALAMRACTTFFFRKFSPRILFSAFGCAAAALVLVALFAGDLHAMFVIMPIAGFVQGSSAGAFVVMCVNAYPGRSASASAIFSLTCGATTLTAPLWMGALAAHTGFLLPMVLICCSLLASCGMIFFKTR